MEYLINFIEGEKHKDGVSIKKYPNGVEIINNMFSNVSVLHSFFKPLNDEQILDLEKEVNIAQMADYKFPDWYKAFFKISNGLNTFFGAFILYGDQTPIIIKKFRKIRSLIERNNPDWMAPYSLRSTNSAKFDYNSKARWLTIGCYYYDGTQVVVDFKKNCITAMYPLPVTISVRELRKMKESDYEKLIIDEWKDFETFFTLETARISEVINNHKGNNEFKEWKKTLPIKHKNFEN